MREQNARPSQITAPWALTGGVVSCDYPGMVMERHWYECSPVVDGSPLLADPSFWAAHLADLYEGLSPEGFGVDPADAEAMFERLHDRTAWPVFHVPLADGHQIVVHYNSGEECTTTDYFLTHAAWAADFVLASTDQDRIGPGLCWPELAALLDAPLGTGGVSGRHARLLLLLPILGDVGVTQEAVAVVVEALHHYGAPEACEALAHRLLGGHPMWGAAQWDFDPDEHSWICEGEYSPRRTPPRLPAGHRAALDRCLAPNPEY